MQGTAANFAQQGDITHSVDAEWRGTVEVPRDLWEANKSDELEHVG